MAACRNWINTAIIITFGFAVLNLARNCVSTLFYHIKKKEISISRRFEADDPIISMAESIVKILVLRMIWCKKSRHYVSANTHVLLGQLSSVSVERRSINIYSSF